MAPTSLRYVLEELASQERYRLLTSLVVPRPIAWVSSVSAEGVPNLAPFSYFCALSASPVQIGVSIGTRREGDPKDSLRNIREQQAFCVNVVTSPMLEAMNATAAALPPGESEFRVAALDLAWTDHPRVPYVAGCPAVLECRLRREVDLSPAPNVFVIGEVLAVRLDPGLLSDDPYAVDPEKLEPVGRLGGNLYSLRGAVVALKRP